MALFKKNAFSAKRPVFSDVEAADRMALENALRRFYPDVRPRRIQKLGAFEINSRNWRIETETEAFILKRTDAEKKPMFERQVEWTSALSRDGFPTLRFKESAAGTPITGDDQSVYCMSSFEEGGYFGNSLTEWVDLVRHEKKLLEAVKSLSAPAGFPSRVFFTEDEGALVDRLKTGLELPGVDQATSKDVVDRHERLLDLFTREKAGLTPSVFHVDIHPHNLIFKNERMVLLTDFESFQPTTTEVSLGFSAYKCLREVVVSAGGWQDAGEDVAIKGGAAFVKEFGGTFSRWLEWGQIDLLKRALHILLELEKNGKCRWLPVLDVQMNGLQEADAMIGAAR